MMPVRLEPRTLGLEPITLPVTALPLLVFDEMSRTIMDIVNDLDKDHFRILH